MNELLEQGCLKLNAALGTGDKYQIRLLVRFFATLSTTNVVSMQAVFGMLDSIVQGAIECIQGGETASGSTEPSCPIVLQCRLLLRLNACQGTVACLA